MSRGTITSIRERSSVRLHCPPRSKRPCWPPPDLGYLHRQIWSPVRILDIRETAIPLKSELRNSSFDFSEMTTSVVAVITDVLREGKPVVGFAFNSTGRCACGAQMRARFIPRILAANPEALLDERGDNLDPEKILD